MTTDSNRCNAAPVPWVDSGQPVDHWLHVDRDETYIATTRYALLPGSRLAAHHVEQAAHDALAIGPQSVVGVLVGDPRAQPAHAKRGVLGQ